MEHAGSYDQWVGRDAYDRTGDKIGEVKDVFYDDVTGRPEWVAVRAGMLKGTHLAPLAGAMQETDADGEQRLVLGVEKAMVADAHVFDTDDGHLSPEDERELYTHYGFDWNDRTSKDFGYGKQWNADRFDKDWPRSKTGAIGNVGVRLRKYEIIESKDHHHA